MAKQVDLTHKWVEMTPRFARWHINHLDIYDSPTSGSSEFIEDQDIEIQLFLMCLMGVPVKGVVKGKGSLHAWNVWFFESGLSMDTYCMPNQDFTLTGNGPWQK